MAVARAASEKPGKNVTQVTAASAQSLARLRLSMASVAAPVAALSKVQPVDWLAYC